MAATALNISACDDSDSSPIEAPNDDKGTVTLSAWGEDYIDVEIPAEDVSDGWTITFEHVLVSVTSARLDGHGNPSILATPRIIDLAAGEAGPTVLESTEVAAGTYPTMQYQVAPPASNYDTTGFSDAAIAMVEDAASIVVIGSATKDDRAVDFYWSFQTDSTYRQCEIDTTIAKDATATVQLTFHVDHLFNDDLDSAEPQVAFELIASADSNGDHLVTNDELRALNIESEDRYQVGSRNITNLYDFIAEQSKALGHINGEGHCMF